MTASECPRCGRRGGHYCPSPARLASSLRAEHVEQHSTAGRVTAWLLVAALVWAVAALVVWP